jgi:hypothetical protein
MGAVLGGMVASKVAGGGFKPKEPAPPQQHPDIVGPPPPPSMNKSYVGSAQKDDGIKAPDFGSIFTNHYKGLLGGGS